MLPNYFSKYKRDLSGPWGWVFRRRGENLGRSFFVLVAGLTGLGASAGSRELKKKKMVMIIIINVNR